MSYYIQLDLVVIVDRFSFSFSSLSFNCINCLQLLTSSRREGRVKSTKITIEILNDDKITR